MWVWFSIWAIGSKSEALYYDPLKALTIPFPSPPSSIYRLNSIHLKNIDYSQSNSDIIRWNNRISIEISGFINSISLLLTAKIVSSFEVGDCNDDPQPSIASLVRSTPVRRLSVSSKMDYFSWTSSLCFSTRSSILYNVFRCFAGCTRRLARSLRPAGGCVSQAYRRHCHQLSMRCGWNTGDWYDRILVSLNMRKKGGA